MQRLAQILLVTLMAVMAALAAKPVRAETATEARAMHAAEGDTTSYTLPPAKLVQAKAITRIRMAFAVVVPVWTLAQLALILRLGVAWRMRRFCAAVSRGRAVQTAVFVFLLLLLLQALNLPLSVYGHRVGLAYGLSVQGWLSWLGDKAKSLALTWLIGSALAIALLWAIRRWPMRWWLGFSVLSTGVVIAGLFVTPYVIDPIFNRFVPMQQADPALVASLERVVARSGMEIPPARMVVMQASAKYTGMNAYVTGFGASKRIVVWDTTIAKASPDEIAVIFGHEMGHYALGHVLLGTALSCAALPLAFWMMYVASGFLLRRYGAVWEIPDRQDLAALVVFLLVAQVLLVVSGPIANAVSRDFEHAADVYGQEAVHGIVADPQGVAVRSFQALGEMSLDDPTPHPWLEWWIDDHPSTRLRTGFAKAYDPWRVGEEPRYFR